MHLKGASEMLTKDDWKSAIEVQDACNLSGVVHSLARILPKIREEKDCTGTDYVNGHPIVRLYVAKLMHLAQMDDPSDVSATVGEAWNAVLAVTEKQGASK
jgi:hypothetical protein